MFSRVTSSDLPALSVMWYVRYFYYLSLNLGFTAGKHILLPHYPPDTSAISSTKSSTSSQFHLRWRDIIQKFRIGVKVNGFTRGTCCNDWMTDLTYQTNKHDNDCIHEMNTTALTLSSSSLCQRVSDAARSFPWPTFFSPNCHRVGGCGGEDIPRYLPQCQS